MKKVLLIFAVLMLSACVSREEVKKEEDFLSVSINVNDQPKEERIKLVNETYAGQRTFYILEVDGHLYLSQYFGGFVHLESCSCKNK